MNISDRCDSNAQFSKFGDNSESYGTEMLASTDYDLYQRHAIVKCQVYLVETHMGRLKSAVAQIGNNFISLQDRVGRIHKSVAGKEDIVKVIESECSKSLTTVGICNAYEKRSNASKDHSKRGAALGTCHEFNLDNRRMTKPGVGLCSRMDEFSAHDYELLHFLFSMKHLGHDDSRELVASYVGFRITRRQILCLAPLKHLHDDVINICGEYLFDNVSSSWFFPTSFGERAKDYVGQMPLEIWVDNTVKICRLQRFYGRVNDCEKIFIPLCDQQKHWFLLVVRIPEKQAELWDSSRSEEGELRRLDIAKAAIWLLDNAFKHDLLVYLKVPFHFALFTMINPVYNSIPDNEYDSGIYVIRQMQLYGTRWYQEFNSEDQRVQVALEIVKHPQNEVLAAVNKSVTAQSILRAEINRRKRHVNDRPIPGTTTDIVYRKPQEEHVAKKKRNGGTSVSP